MKFLVLLFVFLLPFHATLTTFLKCKLKVDDMWISMNLVRFWKEWIIIFLLFTSFYYIYKRFWFSFKKIFSDNYLLWLATSFIISSLLYIYLPFFEFKLSGFLWFKYDTFFLFAMIIGLFLPTIKNNLNLILKTLFFSTWTMLLVFLPWYLLWDISSASNFLWYSDKVSTYEANSCISFAQNVNGEHRFQWSFGWPIRFSVFLVVTFLLFLWFIFTYCKNKFKRNIIISVSSLIIITSIFFSYSKTSILWLIFWIILFIYLVRKIIFHKKISKGFIYSSIAIIIIPLVFLWVFKKDLFLHLWSTINRVENLSQSLEMFSYNPIWYGLWIAGPASQIWNSIESAWSRQIATVTVTKTHRFLPENRYVQILLEQWIIWFALFIALLIVISLKLYKIVKRKKDYLSIWIFSAFIALLFMANFTHAFEESATSYILFLIIWWYLAYKPKH